MRIVLAALACAVGLALYFGSRPVFYGRSLVRLGEPADAVRTRALAKELMQPQLIERTARRLGTQATATELSGTRLFSVEAQPVGAREIEVKVRAFSRAWAEQWGAAMVAEYADFQRVRRRKEAVDFVRGLNRELTEIAEKLGDSEAKRFAATDKAGLALELAEINELRNPARVLGPLVKRIAVLGEVRAQLQNPETPIVEKLSLLAAMEHANGDENAEAASGWESLEVRRRPLLALRAALDFAGLAPEAMAMAIGDEIAELDGKLQAEFDANFHRFDVDYRNLVDQKAALETKDAEPPTPAEGALNLRVRMLAERIGSLGAMKDTESAEVSFGGMRELPERPVSPDPWRFALFTLLGAALLAAVGPMLADRLSFGRTQVGKVEKDFGVEALGSVPVLTNFPRREPMLADEDDARLASLTSVFHEIREKLSDGDSRPRVVIITSAMPGEGKTVAAANLGISFAASGLRTLLVDSDVQRGRLHRLFGYRPAPGLADLLSGNETLETAIRATPYENLCVLNAGNAPASGSDPLAAKAFASTLAQLRESFDLLILDAPPVLGLTATALLAPHADATIVVASSGQVPPGAVRAALESLRGSGAKVRGFILNRAVT